MRPNFIVIPLIVFGVAVLGSAFTKVGIDSGWYGGIIKPEWTPSGSVIGTVWTIIFGLVAASLLIMWNAAAHDSRFSHVIKALVLNGALNVGWSYVFFVQNWMGIAFMIAVVMWFSVIELIISIWPIKKVSSLLLVPYASWLVVACTLNLMVWRMN